MFTRLLLCLCLVTPLFASEDAGHPLRGVVTRRLEEKKLVLVHHEEIPGFMRGMTMAFSVPEDVWPLLQPDVHLTATLHGGRGDWRLRDVVLTDEHYQPLPPAPKFPVAIATLPTPAAAGAAASVLFYGTKGEVGLGWIEGDEAAATLRYAWFDRERGAWGEPQTVASGANWQVSDLNCPQFAVSIDGTLTALWYVNNPPRGHGGHEHGNLKAWISQQVPAGGWSTPVPLSAESNFTEFAALQPLAKGGVPAVWLDGRAKRAANGPQQLYGRVIGTDGPDVLIDNSVCDCCPTALTAFPNGDALVAYRARREGEIRDIHTSLFRRGQWREPRVLSVDDWSIKGCPVNGPQLASHAGDVAVAWFTGAGGMPRIYASASTDAGARFLMPQRIDVGQARGQVDVVQLRDGSRLVTWLESGDRAGLMLRRISPRDEIGPAVRLAADFSGRPQVGLLKDYDATPAELLVSGTTAAGVATLRVTLPDLSTLAGRAPCVPCDEDDALASRGYGVKGRITDWPGVDEVTLRFEEIPGVMRRGELVCKVEPELQATLPVGQRLLGRIEQRQGAWWLFAVKPLGEPIK